MQIITKRIEEIKEYQNNPRDNGKSIRLVANSIMKFGFKVPIIIDKDGVIIAGHTRYRASLLLKLKEIPCIIADDLTEEQIKLFRLVDNKANEVSSWDYLLLEKELEGINNIDMQDFGFDEETIEWDWDDIEEIDEQNYEKPETDKYRCPYCHHEDAKWRFLRTDKE